MPKSKQALQIGDRVKLDLTEFATANLPIEGRIANGVVWRVWLRHIGTEFEDVSYTVRLDRPLLSGHDWTLRAEPRVVPAELTLLNGGDAK